MMNPKGPWIVSGMIFLGVAVFGLATLSAQRFPVPGGTHGGGEVGRYQVVVSSADAIILLDTATGDLYKAVPHDVKPYHTRPHPLREEEEKDGPFRGKKDDKKFFDEKKEEKKFPFKEEKKVEFDKKDFDKKQD
jgi:hypothetical protein